MNLEQRKLVTIVGEAVLEDHMVRDIMACGAKGYTIVDARGEGSRGMRTVELGGKNIRLETLVTDAVAEKIFKMLADQYFPYYAVVAYAENVQVVRGNKYA